MSRQARTSQRAGGGVAPRPGMTPRLPARTCVRPRADGGERARAMPGAGHGAACWPCADGIGQPAPDSWHERCGSGPVAAVGRAQRCMPAAGLWATGLCLGRPAGEGSAELCLVHSAPGWSWLCQVSHSCSQRGPPPREGICQLGLGRRLPGSGRQAAPVLLWSPSRVFPPSLPAMHGYAPDTLGVDALTNFLCY